MHAGELDHVITIQRAVTTPNAYNEPVLTFTAYATLRAKRTDASTGEQTRAAQVGAQISTWFMVRYSPESVTINPKDRLQIEGGLTYEITGVREVERNRWLEISAVARNDQ